ncbi:MAG: hypothetical protein A3D92_24360 [Bacteroidetes bacterium RIFCSPHIGHO2_02_FULL_44_7]|nr:MAG: hypothetical protein A3D92_24360 [Bacteroidetes bacterium RIFCSPHIGHO2_02_FULL_44_7]
MNCKRLIPTPLGTLYAECSERGITLLSFEENPSEEAIENQPASHPYLLQLESELDEYFSRRRTQFELPLDPRGTEFQLKVWQSLLAIPFGSTCSYLQQSKVLGDPKAIRAVAHANGQNKIAILIPCHRVLGSDGSLTGYAGKLWRKKFLLELESTQRSLF